jgi:guanylate kinase
MPAKPPHTPLLAFIGPSGCGKTTLLTELLRRELVAITPTWTDRPVRAGELEVEHRFVKPAEFTARAEAGEFVEVVQPFGLPFRYGLPHLVAEPGRLSVIMIRAPFVNRLRKNYKSALVYQIEAPFEFAKKAMAGRGGQTLGTRLSDFETELGLGRKMSDRTFLNTGRPIMELAGEVVAAMTQDGLI